MCEVTLLNAAKTIIDYPEDTGPWFDAIEAIVEADCRQSECDHEYERALIVTSHDEDGKQTWDGEWIKNEACPKCGEDLRAPKPPPIRFCDGTRKVRG